MKQHFDQRDRETALMRAAAKMHGGRIADVIEPGTMRLRTIEELAATELISLRAERIEKQAEQQAAAAYAAAAQRGALKAELPVNAAPAQTAALMAAEPAIDGPAKRRNRKPSWASVAMPYMKSLFTAGHYKSAAVFYKALKSHAGESGSPFKLVNRELYCTEAGTTVSDGALGNAWPEIREH